MLRRNFLIAISSIINIPFFTKKKRSIEKGYIHGDNVLRKVIVRSFNEKVDVQMAGHKIGTIQPYDKLEFYVCGSDAILETKGNCTIDLDGSPAPKIMFSKCGWECYDNKTKKIIWGFSVPGNKTCN